MLRRGASGCVEGRKDLCTCLLSSLLLLVLPIPLYLSSVVLLERETAWELRVLGCRRREATTLGRNLGTGEFGGWQSGGCPGSILHRCRQSNEENKATAETGRRAQAFARCSIPCRWQTTRGWIATHGPLACPAPACGVAKEMRPTQHPVTEDVGHLGAGNNTFPRTECIYIGEAIVLIEWCFLAL